MEPVVESDETECSRSGGGDARGPLRDTLALFARLFREHSADLRLAGAAHGDGFEGCVERMRAAGVTIIFEPIECPIGWTVTLAAPEGNRLVRQKQKPGKPLDDVSPGQTET